MATVEAEANTRDTKREMYFDAVNAYEAENPGIKRIDAFSAVAEQFGVSAGSVRTGYYATARIENAFDLVAFRSTKHVTEAPKPVGKRGSTFKDVKAHVQNERDALVRKAAMLRAQADEIDGEVAALNALASALDTFIAR